MLPTLLSLKGAPTAEADWRVGVLQAMITTVDGDISAGKAQFKALEGVAPEEALHDAKATSVVVLGHLEKMGARCYLICVERRGLMRLIEQIKKVERLTWSTVESLNDF